MARSGCLRLPWESLGKNNGRHRVGGVARLRAAPWRARCRCAGRRVTFEPSMRKARSRSDRAGRAWLMLAIASLIGLALLTVAVASQVATAVDLPLLSWADLVS